MSDYKRLTKRMLNGKWEFVKEPDGYSDGMNSLGNRLAELEDKIEAGTLVELPCKVGDIMYYLSPEYDKELLLECIVTKIKITGEGVGIDVNGEPKENGLIKELYRDYIGKRVFIAREAAEARLKELEGK